MNCPTCELLKASGEDALCFTHDPPTGILYRVIPAQTIVYTVKS